MAVKPQLMLTMQYTRQVLYGVACLISWLLAGCELDRSSFLDVSYSIQSPPLPSPKGDYDQAVWLNDHEIIFLYAPLQTDGQSGKARSPHRWEYQLMLYSLGDQKPNPISVSKPVECFSGWVSALARLPSGTLGNSYWCNTLSGRTQFTLHAWDPAFTSTRLLLRYPEQFWARAFTFAPDMSQLIQHKDGAAVDDKLYRVGLDGRMEQMLASYKRARAPDWSPRGNPIALVANNTLPEPRSNPFTALTGIGDLLFYPWDLYVMDADESNVHIVWHEIVDANLLRWSPQGDRLAFRGKYKGLNGIWVLTLSSAQLTRVWPGYNSFDWSPDGTRMVIIQRTNDGGSEVTQPTIIQVPTLSGGQ